MRFLADECCHPEMVGGLRAAGHDVRFILEELQGIDDLDVLQLAREDQRVLVTTDLDFGEIVVRHEEPTTGVILLRSRRKAPEFPLARILALIESEGTELHGAITIVEDERFRRRRVQAGE